MRGGVVTIGESLGLVSTGPGRAMSQTHEASLGFGGAESNVAIGVRRLGVPATWIGRVGDDSFGERVARELRAEGVTACAFRDPDAPTAIMLKEQRVSGRVRIAYHRAGSAGSRLSPSDVDLDMVTTADVLHVTGITAGLSASSLATIRSAVSAANAAGTTVSFDVNHRAGVWGDRDPARTYRDLVAAADLVFAGEDEAALVLGRSVELGPEQLLEGLVELTPGAVVLKRGDQGCLARIDNRVHRVPAVPVVPVDTVGAGDAFVAGYLASTLLGAPPAARLEVAVRCGAMACLSLGDWEGLPHTADLHLLEGGDPVRR